MRGQSSKQRVSRYTDLPFVVASAEQIFACRRCLATLAHATENALVRELLPEESKHGAIHLLMKRVAIKIGWISANRQQT